MGAAKREGRMTTEEAAVIAAHREVRAAWKAANDGPEGDYRAREKLDTAYRALESAKAALIRARQKSLEGGEG